MNDSRVSLRATTVKHNGSNVKAPSAQVHCADDEATATATWIGDRMWAVRLCAAEGEDEGDRPRGAPAAAAAPSGKTGTRDVGPHGTLARFERSRDAARRFGEWHPALRDLLCSEFSHA